MKNLIMVVVVCLFFMGLFACGGGDKFAEARATMEEMIDLMNNFGDAIEKAEDGKAVVAAVENFADKFRSLQKKMKEQGKKYPELNDKQNIPQELKDLEVKLDEAGKKMIGAMAKIGQFVSDPEVAKALEKLQQTK